MNRVQRNIPITMAQMNALASACNGVAGIAASNKPFLFVEPAYHKASEEAMLACHEADWGERPGGIVIRTDTMAAYQLTGADYRQLASWTPRSDIHVDHDLQTTPPAGATLHYATNAISDEINYGGPWLRKRNNQWAFYSWKTEIGRMRSALAPLLTHSVFSDQVISTKGSPGSVYSCLNPKYVTTNPADAVTVNLLANRGATYQCNQNDAPADTLGTFRIQIRSNLTDVTWKQFEPPGYKTWQVDFSPDNIPVGTELNCLTVTGDADFLGTILVNTRIAASDTISFYGIVPNGYNVESVDVTLTVIPSSGGFRSQPIVTLWPEWFIRTFTGPAAEPHIHSTLTTYATGSLPDYNTPMSVEIYGWNQSIFPPQFEWMTMAHGGGVNFLSSLHPSYGCWLWQPPAVLDIMFDEQTPLLSYSISKLSKAGKHPTQGEPLRTLYPTAERIAPSHELSQAVGGGTPSLHSYRDTDNPNTHALGIAPGAWIYEATCSRHMPEDFSLAGTSDLPVKIGFIRNGAFVEMFTMTIPAGQEHAPVLQPNRINFTGDSLCYQASERVHVSAMIASVLPSYSPAVPGNLSSGVSPVMLATWYNDTANMLDAV